MGEDAKEVVNPLVGIMLVAGGLLGLTFGIIFDSWNLIMFSMFGIISGAQKAIEAQQKIAKGAAVGGQIGDAAFGPWEDVMSIAKRIDNPDSFIIEMQEHERMDSRQEMMDAEFHGDDIDEFLADDVSNWAQHLEEGPSAVPKDFHHPTIHWHDPVKAWQDPYA